MKVQEFMTSAVESCQPTTNLAAVAMTMWRKNCGIVPVVDESRRVVGVITDRDICMAVATRHRRPEELAAREVMAERPSSIHPEDDVRMALETMRAEKVRRLPVVDAERRIQGIISLNDVVLRAKPAGALPTPGPSANDVLATLQTICEHPVSARPTQRKEALVAVHA